MIRNKKMWLFSSISIILACLLSLYYAFPYFQERKERQVKVRAVSIEEQRQNYESFFNDFQDAKLIIDEETNSIAFYGTKTVDFLLLEELEVTEAEDSSEEITVNYSFNYSADENLFCMSIISQRNDDILEIDHLIGTSFLSESEKIDIVFETDEGLIFLSELEENEIIQNCGWFSNILKKVAAVSAVVAVAAVVVAVAVVAAPAVVAAATTVGTAAAVAGGTTAVGSVAATAIATAATAGAIAITASACAVAATTIEDAIATPKDICYHTEHGCGSDETGRDEDYEEAKSKGEPAPNHRDETRENS